jgi:hypothetical protein
MSDLEIVKPIIENEVEFYVSKDGKQRGISQTGCARLCGIDESVLRRHLKGLGDRTKTPSKSLEHLIGAELYLGLTSEKQAKVLDSKVVASLIAYYAFERNNEAAKYSLSKFASMGIDTWIDKITGSLESAQSMMMLNSINETMGKLMVSMRNLEKIEEETQGYRKATVTLPLLEKWMNELDDAEKKKILAASEDRFTIKEAVAQFYPGTTYSETILRKLSLKVGQTIAALSDKPVPKKDTPNARGFSMKVNSYTAEQLPLVRLCLQSILTEI